MMTFEIVTEEDIPQLFELIETCYRGDIAKDGWTCETDLVGGNRTTKDLLIEEINEPGGKYLKHLNEQGTIVGCVYTKTSPDESRAYVGCLCVHPTIQSQGLGKKLMLAAEDLAKSAGYSKMYMKVLTVRKELIDWYEKLGYKYVGEHSPFPVGCGIPKVPLELGTWEKNLQ